MSDELISEVELFLKRNEHLPIERQKESKYVGDICSHKQVVLDEQARTVTCRKCHKVLDAFWYLSLLAGEWELRKYQDRKAIEANYQLEKEKRNREAKGKYFLKSSLTGDGIDVWESFVALHKEEPLYIYKHMGKWYVAYEMLAENGMRYRCEESFDYIKGRLAKKIL